MENEYVLDACALLAFIYDEDGAAFVQSILKRAEARLCFVFMNKLNLFEVYYNIRKEEGEEQAEKLLDKISRLPVKIISDMSDEVFREAGRIKTSYKISLADSIALGEASVRNAAIVTSDHHEFDVIEGNEKIKFAWFR